MSLHQFLQQLAQCEGSVSVARGVVSFADGQSFDLGASLRAPGVHPDSAWAAAAPAPVMLAEVSAVPGKTLPADFKSAVALLERPYLPIGKADYDAIVALAADADTDVIAYRGRQMTFGDADGGYALMPLAKPL